MMVRLGADNSFRQTAEFVDGWILSFPVLLTMIGIGGTILLWYSYYHIPYHHPFHHIKYHFDNSAINGTTKEECVSAMIARKILLVHFAVIVRETSTTK
eukprot:scaffold96_cov172-Amphora_coffeaeformis.AAC.2